MTDRKSRAREAAISMKNPTESNKSLFRWLLCAVPFLFASCTMVPEIGGMWDKGGTRGRRIVVDLSEQKATLYQYGELKAQAPVSTGREGYRTPTGRFSITEKDIDHRSSIYGDYVRNGRIVKPNVDIRKGGRPPGSRFLGAPMPYFLRFTPSMGLHAGELPGYPASHGCVRLPNRHAKRFFYAVRVGTPVVVKK